MSELRQYAQSHDFATRGKLTLEAALSARIERLDRGARELLELVAVAARPYPAAVFAGALSVNVDEAVRVLLRGKLLRQRKGQELGCYHDRIRHAATLLIAPSRLPALHHQLATALEKASESDPSEQARHWDLAGQEERAGSAYEVAAEKAFDALAFSRAAQFCERAIELAANQFDDRVQRLTIQRADALACAGRSGEAAALYQQAADGAQGEARIQLRSRAAMHLMLGAKIGLGFEAARKLLQELGFSVPLGTGAALLRYAWDTACLALRGSRDATTPPVGQERERLAISVVRELLYVLGAVHPLASFVLSMQYVRRALPLGSRIDSALAFTRRGHSLALRGSLAAAAPLLEQGSRLMEGEKDPLAVASHAYLLGSAHMAAFDWKGASAHLENAQRVAQQHCPDNPRLLTSIRFHLGINWYGLGEHKRLASELTVWLQEARERNDVLAVALLSGMGSGFVQHLMNDAPELALQVLEKTIAPMLAESYSFAHLGHFMGTAHSLLYQGGPSALRFIDSHEAKYGRTFLMRTSTGQRTLLYVRLQAALSACQSAREPERSALIKDSERVMSQLLRRDRSPATPAFCALTRCQLAVLQGRRAEALVEARLAHAGFLALHLDWGAVASYLEGLLEGGVDGQAKCDAVLEERSARGWKDPLRSIGMQAPLHALLGESKPAKNKARTQLILDRYEVTGQLGRGGFGTVVAARDVQTGRTVALKELVRSGGMSLERFKQEFRALSDLHHEHIVQLEALFEHEGTWYIAMERVEGTDLVSYVRASGSCDSIRLREAFGGLARGLSALHQTGFVHRDVKPENVVVTAEGRAVLIDFGLIARAGDERETSPVGSADCAPPEQLLGATPDAAADVYALGTCLYAALSGRLPFVSDSQAQLVQTKQRALPQLAPVQGLEDLTRLCKLMLAPNPELRPTLDDVAAALSESRGTRDSVRSSLVRAGLDEASREDSFAGRELELQLLQQARQRTLERGLSIVLVEGESGLGKSALVADFARRAERATPGLRVFKSRCYENEQVAFKAFDGAVDQLAQVLRALPETECDALLPKRAALLAQLFPVLSSVPAIANAAKKGLPADPAARKQAGSACFIQLLESLAGRSALLFVVDDLQWADNESFDLLRALARRGTSLPMLLVCTVRPAPEIEPNVLSELDAVTALANTAVIRLDALDPAAGLSLARQLLGAELDLARLEALVHESKGHPLFLRELIEHEKGGFGARKGELTLDDALAARIESLPSDARQLLALVALADKPYGSHVYARAMGRPELPREGLVALLGQGLLRRRADKLTCYHDRIRRVVMARLSAEQRAQAAGKLAEALNRDLRADAAERARLWDEAGEQAEALDAYEQAGDQALEGLVFSRAEKHYARALELLGDGPSDERWRRLMVARGQALVRAGRSADAARAFQRAAEHALGEEKVRLRTWAAQHLIQGAHVEEGMRAASVLLAELGVSLPASERAAKGRIVWERVRVKARGVKLKRAAPSAQETLVLEALHGLAAPVRAVSLLPGSALIAQYLRRALNAGDPRHSARALASEALWRNLRAPQTNDESLFEQSHALAEATGEPALIAEIQLTHGVAYLARNNNSMAVQSLSRAHDLLQSRCPGQPWLLTATRMYLGSAWLLSSNFQEIRRHAGTWMEEARAREDRYALAALSGFGMASLRHALDDDPEAALTEIQTAMAPWPKEPFATTHMGAWQTSAIVLASSGDGPRFWQFLEAQHSVLDRAYLMRAPTPRRIVLGWRIHALLQCVESPHSADAPRLLEKVRSELRMLDRSRGLAAGAGHYFEGWLHFLEGDRDAALLSLHGAKACFETTLVPYASGVKYTIGLLEGGESGRQMREEVLAQIRAEGWRDVRRGLRMRLPGNPVLLELAVG
jgi:tetratricopeptide (TPR) repeat protein